MQEPQPVPQRNCLPRLCTSEHPPRMACSICSSPTSWQLQISAPLGALSSSRPASSNHSSSGTSRCSSVWVQSACGSEHHIGPMLFDLEQQRRVRRNDGDDFGAAAAQTLFHGRGAQRIVIDEHNAQGSVVGVAVTAVLAQGTTALRWVVHHLCKTRTTLGQQETPWHAGLSAAAAPWWDVCRNPAPEQGAQWPCAAPPACTGTPLKVTRNTQPPASTTKVNTSRMSL